MAATLLGSTEAAMTQAMQAAEPEIRRLLAETLATDPGTFRLSDAEREDIRTLGTSSDIPIEQLIQTIIRNRFLFQGVFVRMGLPQQRATKQKVSPKFIAECFDGELPPGWDDMLPKNLIDNDRNA